MTTISKTALFLTVAASLIGCQQGLDDNRYPTGSTSMISTAQYDAVVTANVDEGTVTRLDLETGTAAASVDVGTEPTRIARISGDRMLVTLRGDRAVAKLDASGDDLRVIDTVTTGTEPYGIVAREDGSRFYVAASTEGIVQEFDAETLELLRSFSVANEPRWLALHPDDGEVTVHQPPAVTGMDPNDGSLVTLTTRVTGDPAVHPNGRYLAVPCSTWTTSPRGPTSAPA
ncbi:MAG: hypothetical protein GY898_08655 [Proteobacteria bacterium]|nr:hypothetical protein [Pseudomonadota bacterium]